MEALKKAGWLMAPGGQRNQPNIDRLTNEQLATLLRWSVTYGQSFWVILQDLNIEGEVQPTLRGRLPMGMYGCILADGSVYS
jgi:hypothetical protein